MTKPREDLPRWLVVEGYSDLLFYAEALEFIGLPDRVYIKEFNGRANLDVKLHDLINDGFLFEKTHIGVIVDADTNAATAGNRFAKVLTDLTKQDVGVARWTAGSPHVGLWVAPGGEGPGEIETLAWNAWSSDAKNAGPKACIESFVACMGRAALRAKSPDKALVGALLAVGQDLRFRSPGVRVAAGFPQRLWFLRLQATGRRRAALVAMWVGGLLAAACDSSSGARPGSGGAGAGGTGPADAAAGTGGGATSGGGGAAGAGSGGATATTRGTGGAASGGTTAGTGGAGSGGATGTRPGAGGSGAGGRSGSGGTSGGGSGGKSDAARGDAEADVADAVLRDALGERVGTGGAGGARSDGPPGTGGSGDGGGSQKITVWLAGDSTMMNCTGTCPCGWGSELLALLNSNATVVNSAVGGRSVQTWLYDPNVTTTMSNGECVVSPKTYSSRWQAMLDGMKPGDYLLVEFGINDGDSTCNRHVGTALFQSYLGTMAQAAKQLGAQPIFLTSTSYIGCSGSTATTNRGFVSETKAAGQANGVPVIDLTALSAALYTSLGLCPNGADYTSTGSAVGKFFCEDHTHFEAAGAAQIAKLVAKALKDQGIGLAAYLR
jgi:lysophospholipase L1-like esterase